ncbi:hypothetical protein [Okeania sp.]|uniref:WD40 domain-containing protein n=1 Tax=Okeania sp. TaxID=3100323 RepID=UPI002B4B6049|nr:hypothetical protein [Okeania sp.]MEB3339293.1 hypothetical protein [Okeania sp.]
MPEDFNQNSELLSELIFALEMSQGEFRLFLARSNTLTQRDRIMEKLKTSFDGNLAELELDESVEELYTTIEQHLEGKQPDALMVFGLEFVSNIDQLLVSMGLVREEFRDNFHFPILLWIDVKISQKFIQLIPDFESWTSLTVFETPTQELIDFIQQISDRVYHKLLEHGAGIFLDNTALGVGEFVDQELLDAQQELSKRGVKLEPELEAGLKFVLGRTADNSSEKSFEILLEYYNRSLELWQQLNNLVRVAHTYYYLGLLWCSYQFCYRVDKDDIGCYRAASYYQKSVETFEKANRPDLAAKFINSWGELLQILKNWDKLETVACKAIKLHQTYCYPFREARAYGFLAEIELTKNHYKQAKKFAQKALKILTNALANNSNCTSIKEELNLDWQFSHYQGKYLFALGKSEKGLGETKGSIARLEQAIYTTKPEYNPEFYINILIELREIYYQQKEYLKAFKIKQEQLKIEQQFGFQAFIGANRLRDTKLNINPTLPQLQLGTNQKQMIREISASGRQFDVEILLERISRPDYKLIVIHGQSGVGKSSILQAGLVPILKEKSIDTRDVVVVLQQVYVNWISELGKILQKEVQRIGNLADNYENLNLAEEIFTQLEHNAKENFLTVIIFDQFEEFFFANFEQKQKQEFAFFLGKCLKIPFLKIVLSLRSDYIHYLLDFNHLANLETINNDILSENILYCLGNFSKSQAKSVIQGLTQNSQFKIDNNLIEMLVEDLAEELGEIRPIELQVMGAQLQRENITTLAKYQELGDDPKGELVDRYLESVVEDCGRENEKLAWLVLVLLTDENNTRPLKTKAELEKESNFSVKKLNLVLKIFVDSGLVFLSRQNPEDQYQLVHDYLVKFIRQRKEVEILEELKQEREKRQELQKRMVVSSVFAALVMAVLSVGMAIFGFDAKFERRLAENQTIQAQANEAKAHSLLGQRLDEIMSAMRARQKQIDNSFQLKNETSIITDVLRTAVYKTHPNEFREFNRIPRHQHKVFDVEFSQDGKTIATATDDGTLKFWNLQGQLLKIMAAKIDETLISDVDFSWDGKMIAIASNDGTVKLWNLQGELLQTLKEYDSSISDVEFSQDRKTIATATDDGIVRLWNLQGELLQTLKSNNSPISDLDFQSDGKMIATASNDGMVKLWNFQGKLLQTIKAHTGIISNINFSPDGKTLATSSNNGMVKLWNLQGILLRTINAHNDRPSDLTFSPDGKTVVTASDDGTVKLWNLQGELLQTLKGHDSLVSDVEFSPNEKIIVTASEDGTVKLWNLEGRELKTLSDYNSLVSDLAFSPDGEIIATASDDGTVLLWNLEGQELRTMKIHNGLVYDIEFSPNGKTLVTAGDDGTVKLWNLQWQALRTLEKDNALVNGVALSPDGKIIATTSDDGVIKLWSLQGKKLRTLESNSNSISDIVFSPDGKIIAAASNDGTVELWKLEKQELPVLLEENSHSISDIVFSPDGKIIATASDDGTVKLWNLQGKELRSLKGHENSVSDLDFSADGKMIATASNDKTVKLWNLQGELLQTLGGYKSLVSDVEFSPDGKIIATVSRERIIKLWPNLGIEEFTQYGCQLLNDYLISHPEELKELRICQTDKRIKAAALSWVIEGEELARKSMGKSQESTDKFQEAIKKFNLALKWNPDLNLKPKTRAKSLQQAERFMIDGTDLARQENIEAAIEKYQGAKKLDQVALVPTLENLDPEAKAKSEAANALLLQGRKLMRKGKLKEALISYQKAEKFDRHQISASHWNRLCREGTIDKQPADVIIACEKAVALDPKNGNFVDSRGFARVFTGDIEGAIADFQVFVEWTDDHEEKEERQKLIKALQAGKGPSPIELEEFKD